MPRPPATLARLPSVDEVLRTQVALHAAEHFGRPATVDAVRAALAAARAAPAVRSPDAVALDALDYLQGQAKPGVRPVFNLTGTVVHTNLGRALVAEAAIDAAIATMRNPVALEYDLEAGRRGERDDHVRPLLRELTGAGDATLVNNNAAAVVLVLNTLARGREVIVSRGELIEIGGAFRLPEIMARAGAKLVEVGTTNRTHDTDYAAAISPRTALILKVHTSNYRVEGFTADVPVRELARLGGAHGIPVVHDLGSGTLIDLARFGLQREPTVAEAIAEGADLVTFSGDKLLGGPQAGFAIGRSDLIARLNRNPIKRSLRVDKIRLAALEATLKLYRDPDRLAERLPTLRLLTRPLPDIALLARRLADPIQGRLGEDFIVESISCESEIGSGALPLQTIPSMGIAIRSKRPRGAGSALSTLSATLRRLSIPVIGRIENQVLVLDLRCLEDEAAFVANLSGLAEELMS